MRLIRRNPELNDMIEALDLAYIGAKRDPVLAGQMLDQKSKDIARAEIDKCVHSIRYFLENYFALPSSLQGDARVLYPLWHSQEMFLDRVETKMVNGKPVWLIVDKSRQEGISNAAAGVVFWKTLLTERCNTLVIAHNPPAAEGLLNMSRFAYDNLPWWMRPEAEGNARRYMIFGRKRPQDEITDPGLNSRIWVDSGNKEGGVAGISFSIRVLHLSEISSFKDPDTLTDGIFPTLNYKDQVAIIESTARGRRNFFYHMWQEISHEPDKFKWEQLFIPDIAVSYHHIPFEPGETLTRNQEEESIVKEGITKYGIHVPDEYFNWRRAEIRQYVTTSGSDEKFYQEHPNFVHESFQATGISAFPKARLREMEYEGEICPPAWVGEISLAEDNHTHQLSLAPFHAEANFPQSKRPGSRLSVWSEPVRGYTYYIGADVAQGVEGGDFSCVQVLSLAGGPGRTEQVAEWHGWCSPRVLARVIGALGYWYNECEIAPEANDVGKGVIDELYRNIGYTNWYVYTRPDKMRRARTDFLSWQTQANNRPLLFSNFIDAVAQRWVLIHSSGLLEEMYDCSDEDGEDNFRGQHGHDDRVMAMGIALYCSSHSWTTAADVSAASKPNPGPKNSEESEFFSQRRMMHLREIDNLMRATGSGRPLEPSTGNYGSGYQWTRGSF